MRERLAIARSKSNMNIYAMEAKADALGVLLLRGIDNKDARSLTQAKFRLALILSMRASMPVGRAARFVRVVLSHLADSRCITCGGQLFLYNQTSVKVCGTCKGTGQADAVSTWNKNHRIVFAEANQAMNRAIRMASLQNDLGNGLP